jgi:hypothetical protein
LLSRHAVRSDAGRLSQHVEQIRQRQARVDDVLDDHDMPSFDAGVEILDEPYFAGRPRRLLITRHHDEVERAPRQRQVPHEIGKEHERPLQDAHEMHRLVAAGIIASDVGGEFGDACGDGVLRQERRGRRGENGHAMMGRTGAA